MKEIDLYMSFDNIATNKANLLQFHLQTAMPLNLPQDFLPE
jgi:hypothetical protein